MKHPHLEILDPEVAKWIYQEELRQEHSLELIPSENSVSRAVIEAQGTVLTNKYAEGYPGKRYYGGCQYVDEVETLAISRAKALFGADHVNVQPHSGSQANMACYLATLKPGDKILGMDLSHGGHLTHGSSVNFSGILFQASFYGVRRDDQRLDYDELLTIARDERPKMIIAGASAYPRTLDFNAFAEIARDVGALLLVDMAHIAGLVAAGLHPSPVDCADLVTCTTHKTLRGPRGGMIMCRQEHAKSVNSRIFPGIQGGPLMHVIAAKAVAFKEALDPEFKTYQRRVIENCQSLAAALLDLGFDLVSGGTDNHMILIDLRSKGLTGKEAERRLDLVGLTVNKNTVPFETESPFVTSGIRLGTPAITTRGMGKDQMVWLASAIVRALSAKSDDLLDSIREEVRGVCDKFPLYQESAQG